MGTLSVLATLALTVSLHVDGTEAGMQGLQMSLDGKSAGVVGDTLKLTAGTHRLSIDLSNGLLATYDVVVGKGMMEVALMPDFVCSGNTSWSFASTRRPTIERRSSQEMRLKLVDPEPIYTGVCQVDLPNLSCHDKVARVRIDSTPETGAALWIDNIPIRRQTPTELSVHFCAGTASRIDVVLRKSGYEPCSVSFDLENVASLHELSCSLRKPDLTERNRLSQCKDKPRGDDDWSAELQTGCAVDTRTTPPV